MAWADEVESYAQTALSTWGIPATITPKDGSPDFDITGILKAPGLEDQYIPGANPGPGVARLWVDYERMDQQPQRGDICTINEVVYDIGDVDAEIDGGAVLRLRKRNA